MREANYEDSKPRRPYLVPVNELTAESRIVLNSIKASWKLQADIDNLWPRIEDNPDMSTAEASVKTGGEVRILHPLVMVGSLELQVPNPVSPVATEARDK